MERNRSKELAYILRHNPSEVEGTLDSKGWLEVEKLLNHGWTVEELKKIVREDKKGRYELSSDLKTIRALQGHSVKGINADLERYSGDMIVYHGTQERFLDSILKSGLLPGSREYVHLSSDLITAKNVALRRGPDIILLKIDLSDFKDDIFISKNGVILVRKLPPKYIIDIFEN